MNNHAHVLRVRSPHSLIYLEYFLESLDYKLFVTGTAQPKLNKGVCEKIRVPVPDARFQGEVEKRLLAFEEALSTQGNADKGLRALLFAMLNQVT